MRFTVVLLALSLACTPETGPQPPTEGRNDCGVDETCSCDEDGAWLVRAGGVLLVEAVCLVECTSQGENTTPCELVIGGEGTLADAVCNGVDCVVSSSGGGCASFDAAPCGGCDLCAEAAACTASASAEACTCDCP